MRRSMCVKGLPAATGKELMLDERAWYEAHFIERIKRCRNFLRESMHEGM